MSLDRTVVGSTVTAAWEGPVLDSLSGLVAIPAVSQSFDPDWDAHGHLAAAIEHVRSWLTGLDLPGAVIEVVRLDVRSPVLLVDIPATAGGADAGTVLLYGHLDKQPPVGGWSEGLDPWQPVVRDGRLYGRGSADDGYAGYAAATALRGVLAGGGEHARCVLLLETGEESGSPDLPAYLEHLKLRLGEVSLVVCLDSGANDYKRMWLTSSLRGLAQAHVTATVLTSGQHSGMAGGIVPSSFRVLRALLERIEDAGTGELKLPELHVSIPENRVTETKDSAAATPGLVRAAFPVADDTHLVSEDETELALNGTWRPSLAITGAAGLPAPNDAGNVLRPFTTLCLSFRLPPTADAAAALEAITKVLTTDVPYGARIELSGLESASGWNAPEVAPWLSGALDEVSEHVFGQPWRSMGLGGSIPFMGLLHETYPDAQFVVTGVLGADSNAHVPDESINLGYAAKLTEAIAIVLDAHARS